MKPHHVLKHVFIPHEHNNYKPHIFRELSIGIILVTSLLLFSLSAGSALVLQNTEVGNSIVAAVLIDLANEDRAKDNLLPLSYNQTLESAAKMKSEDMAVNSYFAHTSPAGIDPWHWFIKAGYTFLYAGENLAINFTESKKIEEAWMNSPKHRDNILDSRFKEIGISKSGGIYNGQLTTFVVQLFGTPADPIVSEAQKTTASTTSITVTKIISSEEKSNKGDVLSATNHKDKKEVVVSNDTTVGLSLMPIVTNSKMAVVKNTQAVEKEVSNPINKDTVYSKWYERIIFNGSGYVDIIYYIFVTIVFIGVILSIFIEVKKQHPKHIAYGLWTLSFLIVIMYINKELFIQHFVFF